MKLSQMLVVCCLALKAFAVEQLPTEKAVVQSNNYTKLVLEFQGIKGLEAKWEETLSEKNDALSVQLGFARTNREMFKVIQDFCKDAYKDMGLFLEQVGALSKNLENSLKEDRATIEKSNDSDELKQKQMADCNALYGDFIKQLNKFNLEMNEYFYAMVNPKTRTLSVLNRAAGIK